jgi:hypothetical protein
LFNTLTQDNLVLRNVGTYDLAISVNEVRQNPSDIRANNIALGSGGFNIPSLLGVASTAPYFHSGRAPTLAAVLDGTADGSGSGTRHHFVPNAADRDNLAAFLASIDDSTPPVPFSTAPPAIFKSLAFDAPLDQLTIDMIGLPDQAYTMESTTNMRTWRTRRSFRAGPVGEFRVIDERPPVPAPREFYRFSIR